MVLFIGNYPLFLLAFQFFKSWGPLPQNPFQSFRSWGLPPKIWISGIRAGYDSMGMRVWFIFQFQILQQYSTNFRHVLQPPQSTFLGQAGRIFFFFHFFAGFVFGWRNCRSDLYILVQDLQNLIADLYSWWKNSRFQKKNRLNRSPDEEDIADLKISGVADNFQGSDFAAQI